MTVWIGNNDVLGGATGGNPATGVEPDARRPPSPADYSDMMQLLAGGLVQRDRLPGDHRRGQHPQRHGRALLHPEATFDAA